MSSKKARRALKTKSVVCSSQIVQCKSSKTHSGPKPYARATHSGTKVHLKGSGNRQAQKQADEAFRQLSATSRLKSAAGIESQRKKKSKRKRRRRPWSLQVRIAAKRLGLKKKSDEQAALDEHFASKAPRRRWDQPLIS